MAQYLDGQYSLNQMINLTYRFKPNRFEYMKRDVIKRITIVKRVVLNPDRPSQPTLRFEFSTRSYPQYTPYTRGLKAGTKQRKVYHDYDNILSIEADENGKFSLESTKWKYRLGSQAKWRENVSQSLVKTVYRETSQKWKHEYDRDVEKIQRKYKGKDLTKKLAEAKKKYKQKFEDQKKKGKYLDAGDFNARNLGINGDFYFRVAPVLSYWGHLYGKDVGKADGDPGKPFLPKHALNLIDQLIKLNILV